MTSTLTIIVLLLLTTGKTREVAGPTQDVRSAAVAQATAATPESSTPKADVPLRQRPRGATIVLVALFGALAGAGIFVARTARHSSEAS